MKRHCAVSARALEDEMGDSLPAVEFIVILERVAAETGLRTSQVMNVMQLINKHLSQMQAEIEFAAKVAEQHQNAPDRGTH